MRAVHRALSSLGVDALVSIGGDDTLKTANKFKRFQDHLPPEEKRIAVVHVPKTIDNDYRGIDFTFGYFTAVETLAGEIRNLLADAEAGRMYFLVETMGRSAGWLAYGAAIAGEASLVLSVEDLVDELMTEETVTDPKTGTATTRKIMNIEKIVDMIVRVMIAREKEGKEFGVIVLAEGLAQYMPAQYLEGVKFDDHGNISLSQTNLARNMTKLVEAEYEQRQGKKRRVTGLQLGYEARCALPHAFDVILGSQLGVGAYRALVENRARRRPDLRLRPAQPELCPVRDAGRPRDARDRRPLHPARAPTSSGWRDSWRTIRTIDGSGRMIKDRLKAVLQQEIVPVRVGVPASAGVFVGVPASAGVFVGVPASATVFVGVPASAGVFVGVPASAGVFVGVPASAGLRAPRHAALARRS